MGNKYSKLKSLTRWSSLEISLQNHHPRVLKAQNCQMKPKTQNQLPK